MKQELEIIRKALERISVRGREDIDLMGMCMDGLDVLIARAETEKESKEHADD
jgi:hypothetical protein